MKKIYFILLFFILFCVVSSYPFDFFGRGIKTINTNSNVVYLTFDDGPSENTLDVLEILNQKNVSATFFLLGNNVKSYPEIAIKIKNEGHGIGIHSMSHPYLYKNVSSELLESRFIVEKTVNQDVNLFRPPYGFTTPFMYTEAENLGLKTILWDVFPRDYSHTSSETLDYIKRNVRKGSIIVLHDGPGNRSQMIDGLPDIIDVIRLKGFEFGVI